VLDLNETMHSMPISTINHENNVLVLLLVHRDAVTTDRKWRCKQIYSYLAALYCIFSKINFHKFQEIKISGNFPEEISVLTTLASTQQFRQQHQSYHARINDANKDDDEW